jgi:hypothetical protein
MESEKAKDEVEIGEFLASHFAAIGLCRRSRPCRKREKGVHAWKAELGHVSVARVVLHRRAERDVHFDRKERPSQSPCMRKAKAWRVPEASLQRVMGQPTGSAAVGP